MTTTAPLPGDDAGPARRADVSRNREAVVAAAFEVLSQQAEASMADIAAASGLGRTTLYRHFPNRDALVEALIADVLESSKAVIDEILTQVDAPADVLPRVAEMTLTLGERYGFLAAHRELMEAELRRPRQDPMRDWIARGVASGSLRPLGADWIANTMLGLIAAAHEEVREGRETRATAARKLGATLVAAYAA